MTGRLSGETLRESATRPPAWHDRIRAALPLFLIGAASFAVSYLSFRMIVEGPGHLPVWSLFTATGAILCAGGTAVVVAGGEATGEESPFFDVERFVLLPREEYEALRGRTLSSVDEDAPRADRSRAPPATEIPIVPPGAVGSETRDWDESPPSPEAPTRIRSAGDLDQALREVESVLASLTDSTAPARPTTPTARGTTPGTAPATPAGGSTSLSRDSVRGHSPAPRGPRESATEAGVCTSCGARIEQVASARHCSACDEPLCVACAARSDWEGHAELCPRCHGLLALSHASDDPPDRL